MFLCDRIYTSPPLQVVVFSSQWTSVMMTGVNTYWESLSGPDMGVVLQVCGTLSAFRDSANKSVRPNTYSHSNCALYYSSVAISNSVYIALHDPALLSHLLSILASCAQCMWPAELNLMEKMSLSPVQGLERACKFPQSDTLSMEGPQGQVRA